MPSAEPADQATFEFLSDEWLEAVRLLREEGEVEVMELGVTVNLTATEVPFGPGERAAHVDTTTGVLVLGAGHLDAADVAITVTWATAKALLVEGNQQAAMQAFLEGKVRVEGDVGKLLAFQSGLASEATHAAARRIRAFTA